MPLSTPAADTPDERALRGEIFTGLDRLAFALEMEAAKLLEAGDATSADQRQEQRLGVRLAQRYVAGVWATEIDGRLRRWEEEYLRRIRAELPSAGTPA